MSEAPVMAVRMGCIKKFTHKSLPCVCVCVCVSHISVRSILCSLYLYLVLLFYSPLFPEQTTRWCMRLAVCSVCSPSPPVSYYTHITVNNVLIAYKHKHFLYLPPTYPPSLLHLTLSVSLFLSIFRRYNKVSLHRSE